MGSTPDPHPDTLPPGAGSDDVEHVDSGSAPDRESVEDTPGTDGGTAGTGGEITQDQTFER